MAYYDPYAHTPSPYTLAPSSAGNGASSYGSNGGASAGAAGTPAAHYATAPSSGSTTPTTPTQPATTAPPTFTGAKPAAYTPPASSPYSTPGYYTNSYTQNSGQYYNQKPNNSIQYMGNTPPPGTPPAGAPPPSLNQGGGASYPHPPPAYLGNDPTTGLPIKNPAYEQWWASLTPAQQAAAAAEIAAQNAAAGTSTSSTNTTTTTATPPGNVMPGWDAVKWADPNKHDYKYDVGHVLAGLPPRTSSMDAAVAAIAKLYPGATRVGNGDVNIPGLGVIDILQNAGAGGTAWQWDDGSRPAATSGAGGASGNATVDALMALVKQLSTPPAATAGAAKTADYTKDPAYVALIQKMNTQLQELQAQNTAGRNTPSFNYT